MYEQLVMFCLGFFVSYLIVRAIRSFRSVAIWIVGCGMISNVQGGYNLHIHNFSVTNTYCWIRESSGAQWGMNVAAGFDGNVTVVAVAMPPTRTDYVDAYQDSSKTVYYGTWSGTISSGSTNTVQIMVPLDPPQYTNYPGEIYITNGASRSIIYEITIKNQSTGLVISFYDVTIPAWGYHYDYLVFPYPWSWTAKKKFEWDDNGDPIQAGGQTNNTPNVGTNNIPPSPMPSPTPPTPNRDDPIGTNYPAVTNLYTTNQMVADRQNTTYLADQLSRMIDELKKANLTMKGMSNSQSQIDYTPWWQNQSNKMSNLTNQMDQLTNNTAPLDDTNALVTDWQSKLMQYSNQMSQHWQDLYAPDKMGMFTNQNWQNSATGAPAPDVSALYFLLGTVGGVQHKMNFDYNQLVQDMTMASDFWKISTWLGKWFAWMITFGLWIAVQYRLDDLICEMHLLKSIRRPDSGANKKSFLVNLPLKVALIVSGIALFVVLPTAIITWLNSQDLINPLTVSTPAQEVAANTMNASQTMWKFICHWWNGLLSVVPYATIISAVVTWIAFFHFSRMIAEIIVHTWWAGSIFLPSLVFILLSVNGQATQLKVENLTGTNIVVSNNVSRHIFPQGVTQLENIDPGIWRCGNVGQYTVPDDGKYVIRFYEDDDGTMLMAESGQELSMMDCFLYGMGCGFGIFGSSWAVSCMWWGWRLRHGGDS